MVLTFSSMIPSPERLTICLWLLCTAGYSQMYSNGFLKVNFIYLKMNTTVIIQASIPVTCLTVSQSCKCLCFQSGCFMLLHCGVTKAGGDYLLVSYREGDVMFVLLWLNVLYVMILWSDTIYRYRCIYTVYIWYQYSITVALFASQVTNNNSTNSY